MLSNSTLGDLRADGWTVMGECTGRDCGHGAALDLDVLINRFGADHSVINETKISRHLRCTSCGHLGGDLRLIPYKLPSSEPLYGGDT